MGFLLKHVLSHPSGRLSYRRVFPEDIRPFVPGGRREHKASLGLQSAPDFLVRYDAEAKEYDRLVALARRRRDGAYDPLDPPRIAFLVEVYRAEALEDDEEARWSTDERDLYRATLADLESRGIRAANWRGDESRRWASKTRETAEVMLALYRDLRSIGDLEGVVARWRESALELIEAQGLLVDPQAEEPLRQLCRALNDAGIWVCEAKLERLCGRDVPTPPAPEAPKPVERVQAASRQVPLLATFEAYAASQGLSPGVREEWRRYIKRLIDFLGNDDAAALTADRLREWRDQLLAELSQRGTLREPVTVRDKYITPVRATLAWAVEERLLSANVANEVRVRVPKKVKTRERDFTVTEALAVLSATLTPGSSRLAPGHLRARRWVPWLCAYSGGRVNEFSQLRGQDVMEIEGIWVVRITPEAGRVKTKEARTVPLHSHLIDQGFLTMVKEQGHGPLFYDPDGRRGEGDASRHFKKVGERLAEWVRKEVGIDDPGIKPNHAWRHTFKSLSYECGIEERVVDAIQGHAPASTGRKYGRPSLKALATAISMIPRFDVRGV